MKNYEKTWQDFGTKEPKLWERIVVLALLLYIGAMLGIAVYFSYINY